MDTANFNAQRKVKRNTMANPFSKFWNYLMALFDNKIEENADPKIQIEQAISEAQRQHQALFAAGSRGYR